MRYTMPLQKQPTKHFLRNRATINALQEQCSLTANYPNALADTAYQHTFGSPLSILLPTLPPDSSISEATYNKTGFLNALRAIPN